MKGIEPPQPTKTGSSPLKISLLEPITFSLNASWNSGAQKPSAALQGSKSILAPKVESSP
jgi:hypothetical protein